MTAKSDGDGRAARQELHGLQRLQHQRRTDDVTDALRRAILGGTFPPGSQLREVQIAAELGVSRAPLREALRTLEEEGLVTKMPYRGAFVTEVGPDVIEEIASLRVHLEPFATELALPHLRELDFAPLADAVHTLDVVSAAGDLPGSIDAHLAVHRVVYEHARHGLLLHTWRSWETQLRLYLAMDHATFAELHAIAEPHQRLLELIRSGDMRATTAELRRHIEEHAHEVAVSQSVQPTPDASTAEPA